MAQREKRRQRLEEQRKDKGYKKLRKIHDQDSAIKLKEDAKESRNEKELRVESFEKTVEKDDDENFNAGPQEIGSQRQILGKVVIEEDKKEFNDLS